MRPLVAEVVDAHQVDRLVDAERVGVQRRHEPDELAHRHVTDQRTGLQHHTDEPIVDRLARRPPQRRDGPAIGSDEPYGLFGHDFRRVPVDALMERWTERGLARHAAKHPEPSEQPLVLSQAGFTDAVRQGLRDLHRPDLLARNPLLRTRLFQDFVGAEPRNAEALARLLLTAVDALRRHPRDDGRLRALERTYVRPAPTQEAAADVLGLPFSTYRRHLSQGVSRVVDCLWDHEVYGTTPERD